MGQTNPYNAMLRLRALEGKEGAPIASGVFAPQRDTTVRTVTFNGEATANTTSEAADYNVFKANNTSTYYTRRNRAGT